jgi:hypothetical protein
VWFAALACVSLAGPAAAQQVFKCTTPKGTVTYQDAPCPVAQAQKRADTSHGALASDVNAREMLEREGYRGNRLASEFAGEARERERREYLERVEREERLRREGEGKTRSSDEPAEWMPPWGWAGPPGLARPKPKPTP